MGKTKKIRRRLSRSCKNCRHNWFDTTLDSLICLKDGEVVREFEICDKYEVA